MGGCGAFYRISATDGSITQMGHKTTSYPLSKGDIIRVVTPGAGGYGDPFTRDTALVLKDVIEQKVSVEEARASYGVAIQRGENGEYMIDEKQTDSLRGQK